MVSTTMRSSVLTDTQRSVIIYAAVRIMETVEAIPMESGRSRNRRVNAFRRWPLINGVFQVHDTTRRVGSKPLSRFAITLTSQGKRYEAIAGPEAAALTVGDIVRLHGCFLCRGSEMVLVVCSLRLKLARAT